MDWVDRLIELIPPPASPVRADGDWADFARRNGFEAPADYRRVIESYGLGEFGGGWVQLLDPFHPDQSLVEASEWDRQNIEGQRRQFPEFWPAWPIWPEPGGFLPFASTSDGDLIGWLTLGHRDDCSTAYWGDDAASYSMGMAAFLVAACEGRVDSFGGKGMLPMFVPSGGRAPPVSPPGMEAAVRFAASPDQQMDFELSLFTLADQGVSVVSFGTDTSGGAQFVLRVWFPPDREQAAKAAVARIATAIDGRVLDVHDLRHQRIWPDL